MKTIDTHGTYAQAIDGRPAQITEIADRLRALIIEIYPDVVEVPWPVQGIIGYGVGPKKMSEHFCYVGLYKSSVNLGFYHGVDMPDPDGLLEGTGKRLRHVKIEDPETVNRPEIRRLIEASLKERQQTLEK